MRGTLGIVSGSGLELSALLDLVKSCTPFSALPRLHHNGLEGHARRFHRGQCASREVILQAGRLHFYEGLSYDEVTRPVDIMREWGVEFVVLTNVSGGLRADIHPGEIVGIDRVLTWPFKHWSHRPETLIPDFRVPGCDRYGVYCWVHGPSYETPSEVRCLQAIGADVVGMSTAPELMRCLEVRIPCAVVSCVTNICGDPQPLSHEAVVAAAATHSAKIVELLRTWIYQGCPAE